jgi:hypothetical protein
MATSLLKRGENAIVIFTYGRYFQKKHDGSGSTGNWVIDEKRKCNQVIIYNRTGSRNDIYIARRQAVRPSRQSGRFVMQLADIQYFGTTYFNWPQFSGSRNPVRYLRMPSQPRGKRRTGSTPSAINPELLPAAE